jgi:regulator of replication initiation timing
MIMTYKIKALEAEIAILSAHVKDLLDENQRLQNEVTALQWKIETNRHDTRIRHGMSESYIDGTWK